MRRKRISVKQFDIKQPRIGRDLRLHRPAIKSHLTDISCPNTFVWRSLTATQHSRYGNSLAALVDTSSRWLPGYIYAPADGFGLGLACLARHQYRHCGPVGGLDPVLDVVQHRRASLRIAAFPIGLRHGHCGKRAVGLGRVDGRPATDALPGRRVNDVGAAGSQSGGTQEQGASGGQFSGSCRPCARSRAPCIRRASPPGKRRSCPARSR